MSASPRLFLLAGLLVALAGCNTSGGLRFTPPGPRTAADSAAGAPVEVWTARGTLGGVLHPAPGATAAVLMLGGARGGTDGPARIYPLLARRLREQGVSTLRLRYRGPGNLPESVFDARAALRALERAGYRRVVLLGWSFGGAVAISAGAESGLVRGVATYATQSAGTEAAPRLAPRPLLLFHGDADEVLGDFNSRGVLARAGEPRELVIVPGAGHRFAADGDLLVRRTLAWALPLLR